MKIEVKGKTINQSKSLKYLRILILIGKIISNKRPKEYQEVLVSFVKLGIMLMLGVVTWEATSTSSNWASLSDIVSSKSVASSFSFTKSSV